MHRFQRFWWVRLELFSFDFNDLRIRWNRCDISMNITRIKNLKPVLKSTQKTELKSGEVEPNRVSAWFYTNFWNFSCRKFLEVSRFRWNSNRFSMNITRIKNVKSVLKSTQKMKLKRCKNESSRVNVWFYTNFWNFWTCKFLEVSTFRWKWKL